ncbi:hypothetical protein EJ03DRAFT_86429 [Teratosphaeria nubilosa]|uniref:Uncharacterized protein n=1 Tax=Teratosphaeria nubilosa TaxID=161662 RepID=A0A6G1LAE9_9PEZI|nr:hypothetical protein EJ03DRAFT_86429 [Teratosphaeria nubilosa]
MPAVPPCLISQHLFLSKTHIHKNETMCEDCLITLPPSLHPHPLAPTTTPAEAKKTKCISSSSPSSSCSSQPAFSAPLHNPPTATSTSSRETKPGNPSPPT